MQDSFDILIRNASVVDGTGAPRYPGDIGIRGIASVIVNGAVVWQGGKPTGSRPGRVLKREAAQAET